MLDEQASPDFRLGVKIDSHDNLQRFAQDRERYRRRLPKKPPSRLPQSPLRAVDP
jgi:hypothetical protein